MLVLHMDLTLNVLLQAHAEQHNTAQTQCDNLTLFFIMLDVKLNIFEVRTAVEGKQHNVSAWDVETASILLTNYLNQNINNVLIGNKRK